MAIDTSLIDKLRATIKGGSQVATPADPEYLPSLQRWSTKAVLPAAAVLLAKNTPDIQSAIAFAAANNIELAVRGGGHATSGSSSSHGGLVIDLSLLRGVTVDPEAKTVTAQGGCLWLDVDTAAAAHGLACVAGTVNDTGIGGLTLGGGFGWKTPRYGLVVDNLLSVKMVLADGRLVTASHTENEDLFWGVRGAGANFGCAVEFVYRAHEQKNKVWAGLLAFTPDKLEAAFKFADTVMSPDTAMGIIFSAPPPMKQPLVLAVVMHNGPEGEAKKVFGPLLALGPVMDTTAEIPWEQVNSVLSEAAMGGMRAGMKGMAFATPVDVTFAQEVFDCFASFLAKEPEFFATMILWEYIGTSEIRKVGITETAFASRGEYLNGVVVPRWEGEAKDEVARGLAKKVDALFKAEREKTRVQGETGVEQYANYAGWFDSKPRQIYGVNLDRLVELKAKYDPGNVFCKFNPIISPVEA